MTSAAVALKGLSEREEKLARELMLVRGVGPDLARRIVDAFAGRWRLGKVRLVEALRPFASELVRVERDRCVSIVLESIAVQVERTKMPGVDGRMVSYAVGVLSDVVTKARAE